MSFLKQLLTPFVEFEEDKNKQQPQGNKAAPQKTPASNANPAAPKAAPASASAPPTPASPAAPPSAPAPSVDANVQHPLINSNTAAASPASVPTYSPSGLITIPLPEHEQYFERLIDDANNTNPAFQGTDFKEFVDSKVDIDDIQDEALKYRTAFNVLKSTGLTKEKLFSTGQEYLNVIGRDMNAFQSAHSQKYQKEVRHKEQQIQKKAEELQALTQRINSLKAEINQLTQEINITRDNLNTVKNSYLLAGEKKQKEIQAELERIAQYF